VENIIEKMLDEFSYYEKEELFTRKEIKKIVKQRRESEYQMYRKDCGVEHFLKSIKFEQDLETIKKKRKKKNGK
jgi:U3 small nucleolar RNA-associated protein 6